MGLRRAPPHKDIQKTALGATDSVEWEYKEDAVELVTQLQERWGRSMGDRTSPRRHFFKSIPA